MSFSDQTVGSAPADHASNTVRAREQRVYPIQQEQSARPTLQTALPEERNDANTKVLGQSADVSLGQVSLAREDHRDSRFTDADQVRK